LIERYSASAPGKKKATRKTPWAGSVLTLVQRLTPRLETLLRVEVLGPDFGRADVLGLALDAMQPADAPREKVVPFSRG
jgi:hypothetical protein